MLNQQNTFLAFAGSAGDEMKRFLYVPPAVNVISGFGFEGRLLPGGNKLWDGVSAPCGHLSVYDARGWDASKGVEETSRALVAAAAEEAEPTGPLAVLIWFKAMMQQARKDKIPGWRSGIVLELAHAALAFDPNREHAPYYHYNSNALLWFPSCPAPPKTLWEIEEQIMVVATMNAKLLMINIHTDCQLKSSAPAWLRRSAGQVS